MNKGVTLPHILRKMHSQKTLQVTLISLTKASKTKPNKSPPNTNTTNYTNKSPE